MLPFHDCAALLSTGDEVVLGQIADTNARFLAQQLVERGVMPTEHAAVPDDLDALTDAIERLATRVPLIIMTGGLGPTDGDLTRPALARVLGCTLVEDPAARMGLETWLARRNRAVNERQLRQAQRPSAPGSACLPNAFGTAPGLHVVIQRAGRTIDLFALPGPPGELRAVFAAQVLPLLRPPPVGHTVRTRLLHVIGIGEADAVTKLGDLTKRTAMPLAGITASGAVLTIRIRYQGSLSVAEADSAIDEREATVRAALSDMVFATGNATLPSTVLDLLKSQARTLATVESCTGGLIGEHLTAIPGSSAAYAGGWVTYSNAMKQSQVAVSTDLLAQHGAVSAQVATAMARGGLAAAQSHHALAVTGIAGPDGGSAAKPVGTVYIAHAFKSPVGEITCDVRHFLFTGERDEIRLRAARMALAMLYFNLVGRPIGEPKLLWQQ